jgi:hypothetical protein
MTGTEHLVAKSSPSNGHATLDGKGVEGWQNTNVMSQLQPGQQKHSRPRHDSFLYSLVFFFVSFNQLPPPCPTIHPRTIESNAELSNKPTFCCIWWTSVTFNEMEHNGFNLNFRMIKRYPGVKVKESYPCNRPWRPIGLWDVEVPTSCLHNRLTDVVKVVSLRRRPPFTPEKDSWY